MAYAIGVSQPVSLVVNSFGSGKIEDSQIEDLVKNNFDLTPKGIRDALVLRTNRYQPTASYGHFGRTGDSFPWEKLDKLDIFKKS